VRALRALERASGKQPILVRIGGSVPIVPRIAALGIPVIVGGFKLPGDAIHAPDESFRLGSLKLAEAWARELFAELRDLPAGVS
jgi:acetylornithine deacetylase/succinyl-diaminopimelate desuccinylase-like protein